ARIEKSLPMESTLIQCVKLGKPSLVAFPTVCLWLALPPASGVECPDQGDCRKSRDDRSENPRRDTFEDDAFGYQSPADEANNPIAADTHRDNDDKSFRPGTDWLGSIPSLFAHSLLSN